MKRIILLVLLVVIGVLSVGCATTKANDVFRFEVRELKLTLNTNGENKAKELKLIRGDTDKNATIIYTVSYVDGEKAGTIDMNNGIIEVIGSGTNDKGYVTTTGIGDNVKVMPISEGSVRFSAYIQGNENIVDTIIITVSKEGMSAFSVSPVYSTIYVGTTTTFRSKALPSTVDASILKYEVSDENIATIDASGVLKGLAIGEVTVKAYSKYDTTMYSTTKVKITYADAGKILFYDADDSEMESDENIVLTKGDTFGFSTVVKPKETGLSKDSVNQKVTYETSDSSVIKVKTNEEGLPTIEALSGGTATLTVKSADGKATFTINVNVNWAQTETFELEKEEFAVYVKKTDTIVRKEIVPANANPNIVVNYKDEESKEIVKIDGNKIEGLKPGTAHLVVSTIESEGNVPLEKEIVVVVDYDVITEIKLQTENLTIVTEDEKFKDGQYQFSIPWSVVPAGANPNVSLVSNDSEIAKVEEDGKITVLDKVGTATITITSAVNPEVSNTFVVKVTNKPTSFDVTGPEDETVFVYADNLVVQFTVSILPDDVAQDTYDVYIDCQGECFVDYTTDGNIITLIFDQDSLGKFDVEISVVGIKTTDGANSWIRSYEIKESGE